MADLAAATAAVLALLCDSPAVVHVNMVSDYNVVGIYVRGSEDRAEVERLLEGTPYSTVVHSTLRFGDLTSDTMATKWTRFVATWWWPPDRWPAFMGRYRNRLFEDVSRREEQTFAAMDEEAKTQAIGNIIARRRDHGSRKFGNCWTGPVAPLNAEVKALYDGLEAMQAEVLAAALDMPGVINAETGVYIREREYASIVTVTPSADEDAVIRQVTAINGGTVHINQRASE